MFLEVIPINSVSFMNFRRPLRKCQDFILIQRSGAVGIFLSKIETSPNCFKFHIQVPGGDSNKLCKFHEFRRTLRNVKISSFFLGPAVLAFFCQKLKLLQTASNCTCMFLEVIPINSVSFMNFGELWEMSKFHPFSKVRRCRHFSVKNWNFSKLLQISHACSWRWFQ